MTYWQTSRRKIPLNRPLVMGILNVTPDSFSDGGSYSSVDAALQQVEKMIEEGADIIDIGGESTRPGSQQVDPETETSRTAPVVAAIAKRFDVPISIDTSKAVVANANLDAGAEIVNDISGLRWDERIALTAARTGCGLVLMHSRGEFESMHSQPPVDDIVGEVVSGLRASVDTARAHGITDAQIVLDIGLGFGKTLDDNLTLMGQIDRLAFGFPMLVGGSRKSFIGRITETPEPRKRLAGSIAAAVYAVTKGAKIVRVHDIRETVHALRVVTAIGQAR